MIAKREVVAAKPNEQLDEFADEALASLPSLATSDTKSSSTAGSAAEAPGRF